jgi:hypothetical protein
MIQSTMPPNVASPIKDEAIPFAFSDPKTSAANLREESRRASRSQNANRIDIRSIKSDGQNINVHEPSQRSIAKRPDQAIALRRRTLPANHSRRLSGYRAQDLGKPLGVSDSGTKHEDLLSATCPRDHLASVSFAKLLIEPSLLGFSRDILPLPNRHSRHIDRRGSPAHELAQKVLADKLADSNLIGDHRKQAIVPLRKHPLDGPKRRRGEAGDPEPRTKLRELR